jgi:predicted nuclease of restriction endonuclease-like (RecB) superfamily
MENEIMNLESSQFTGDYVKDIKNILKEAQRQSYRAVNSVMVQSYWLIGYRIVEQEQNGEKRAGYGEKLIENLSRELSKESGLGMSEAQLKNCRQFYLTFSNPQICYTLCSELSWSHLRLIMRLDSKEKREYYINESKNGNWSVRELERNIKTLMYERTLSNQIKVQNENQNDLQKIHGSAGLKTEAQIKDPYILEFLGIKPELSNSEKSIENAIISNLEKFLLEMGRGFSFIERQMHVKTETQDFYIDLVFCFERIAADFCQPVQNSFADRRRTFCRTRPQPSFSGRKVQYKEVRSVI